MSALVSIAMLALLAAFVATAVRLRRYSEAPRPFTAAAWGCLLAAGLVAGSGAWPYDPFASTALAALFPPLLLAAELQRARRPFPRGLFPLLGVLALARAATTGFDPQIAPLLAAVVDVPVLLACGAVAWRGWSDRLSPVARFVPIALALLAVPRLLDAYSDWGGGTSLATLPVWIALAVPTVVLQLWAGLESARREAKLARDALAASVRRFDLIADGGFDLVSEHDPEGRFLYASPSYRTVLGWEPDELVGTSGYELIHPDDRKGLLDFTGSVGPGGAFSHPRLRVRQRDGSWRVFEGTARPYQDEEGRERVVVVNRDVTDRLRFEQNARNAQRFESLLLLANGVAHEFNNLLVPIVTSVDLLRGELPPGAAESEILLDLEAGARRATQLSEQLLDLSNRHEERRVTVDLSELVGEVTRLFVRTLPGRVSLHSKLSSGLPLVEGDPTRLRQVVTILLANASEALGDAGGTIEVTTGLLRIDGNRPSLEMNVDLAADSYVYLEISDDGPGVDPEFRDRIFDPFVTTKPAGHGLGLAVLMGTVRSLGGGVEVRSAPGQGSIFRILLPQAVLADEERIELDAPATPRWRGRGRILLVEDEGTVRRAARRALESLGFSVVETRSGNEAIQVFRRSADDFAAVVLDAVMPELSGDQTYNELCRIRPDPRVLLTSGYLERAVIERLTARRSVRFLQKPYTIGGLADAMRELLDDDRDEPDARTP